MQHVNYRDFITFLESAGDEEDMAPELEEGETQRDDFFNLPMATPHAYDPPPPCPCCAPLPTLDQCYCWLPQSPQHHHYHAQVRALRHPARPHPASV